MEKNLGILISQHSVSHACTSPGNPGAFEDNVAALINAGHVVGVGATCQTVEQVFKTSSEFRSWFCRQVIAHMTAAQVLRELEEIARDWRESANVRHDHYTSVRYSELIERAKHVSNGIHIRAVGDDPLNYQVVEE